MLGPSRNNKIASLLRKVISDIIINEVKDPRVNNLVSISDVELSNDKSLARVHITMLAAENQHIEAVEGLNKAAGFIRSQLIHRVDLKYVPRLKFIRDDTITKGQRLEKLINDVTGNES